MRPRFQAALYSYFVTNWFLAGLLVFYAAVALPVKDWYEQLPLIVLAPVGFTPIISLMGFFIGVGLLEKHEYAQGIFALSLLPISVLAWRGVWWLMYGKSQKP